MAWNSLKNINCSNSDIEQSWQQIERNLQRRRYPKRYPFVVVACLFLLLFTSYLVLEANNEEQLATTDRTIAAIYSTTNYTWNEQPAPASSFYTKSYELKDKERKYFIETLLKYHLQPLEQAPDIGGFFVADITIRYSDGTIAAYKVIDDSQYVYDVLNKKWYSVVDVAPRFPVNLGQSPILEKYAFWGQLSAFLLLFLAERSIKKQLSEQQIKQRLKSRWQISSLLVIILVLICGLYSMFTQVNIHQGIVLLLCIGAGGYMYFVERKHGAYVEIQRAVLLQAVSVTLLLFSLFQY